MKRKIPATELTRALETLTHANLQFLLCLDALMKRSHSAQRDADTAILANALDFENDRIRFGILGVDFRGDAERNKWPVDEARLDQILAKLRQIRRDSTALPAG